jgi:hypothetical protein
MTDTDQAIRDLTAAVLWLSSQKTPPIELVATYERLRAHLAKADEAARHHAGGVVKAR